MSKNNLGIESKRRLKIEIAQKFNSYNSTFVSIHRFAPNDSMIFVVSE